MTFVRRIGSAPELDPGLDRAMDDWLQQFTYMGNNYGALGGGMILPGKETIGQDFVGLVRSTFKSNSIVFACMLVRQMIFSEARFQYRRFSQGRPGALFGDTSLLPLEKPWPGGTTGDLLSRAIQDVDIAGNSFTALRPNRRLRRLRPDWVEIILGTYESAEPMDYLNGDIDAEVVGYLYTPGGPGSGKDLVPLLPEEVAHFAPIPDPEAHFRGMSWLNPIFSEILGDKTAMSHKLNFLQNGAALKTVVTLNESTPDKFDAWVEKFKKNHDGRQNAYRTLFLGAGADVKVVGVNLKDLDLRAVMQGDETRVAAAAGVHPIIAGFESGLTGSSLNAGNFTAARRRFADGTMRPLWRSAAGAFGNIIAEPDGAELWYDDRDIAFLQDDHKDAADRRQSDAIGMRQAIEAGWTPESVREAWLADDMGLLKHSGLVTVQLQDPTADRTPPPDPSANGNGNGEPARARDLLALTP